MRLYTKNWSICENEKKKKKEGEFGPGGGGGGGVRGVVNEERRIEVIVKMQKSHGVGVRVDVNQELK